MTELRKSAAPVVSVSRILFAFSLVAALGLALPALQARAETLRVTSWNLQGAAAEPLLRTVADHLKPLRADVILLQGVRDWQTCRRLTEALQPEQYKVLICSAFRDSRDLVATNSQVAVLANANAYFSWSEAWHGAETGGAGVVFVALQVRGQRLGFFSASLTEQPAAEVMLEHLRQQTDEVGRWNVNRVQCFVVGLSGERSAASAALVGRLVGMLQDTGYTDTLDALATEQRATVVGVTGQAGLTCDFLLAQPAVFPSPVRPGPAVMGRFPLTCDLELDSARVAAAWTARAQELQLRAVARPPAAPVAQPSNEKPAAPAFDNPPAWWWVLGGAMGTALLFLLWFISRAAGQKRRQDPPLLGDQVPVGLTSASSYTVVVSAPPEPVSAGPVPIEAAAQQPASPLIETHSTNWQQRALAAEQQAAQAKLILKNRLTGRLARWLKKKFVRRLASDRAQLLQVQQSAAFQALQVDERLARIEKQIQQQTQSYERRLEELTLELVAAREENRELIRARIAQVKLEMETVRARLRTEATQR